MTEGIPKAIHKDTTEFYWNQFPKKCTMVKSIAEPFFTETSKEIPKRITKRMKTKSKEISMKVA